MAEYVYAIIGPATPPPRRSGLNGRPLRTVAGSEVAALVSSLDGDDLRLARDQVMAHNDVLQAALEAGPVLPVRLGTVMLDEEEVRARLLEPNAVQLREQLSRLTGTFEAEIRAVYDESTLIREAVEADPAVGQLRLRTQRARGGEAFDDRVRLGEAVAAAVQRIRDVDARALLAELTPHCLDVHVSPPAHERVALRAAVLLDDEHGEAFDAALESIAARQAGRIHFRYVGPLAPHSFVELTGAG